MASLHKDALFTQIKYKVGFPCQGKTSLLMDTSLLCDRAKENIILGKKYFNKILFIVLAVMQKHAKA